MKNHLPIIFSLLLSPFTFAQFPSASTWTQINLPTTSNLLDIDFPSNEIGYIGAANGELLKSIDGGITWELVNFTLSTPNPNVLGAIYDIEFSDINNGYMLMGANGPSWNASYLYTTSDGGNTWENFAHDGNVMEMGSIFSDNNDHLFLGGVGFFESSLILEYDNFNWTQNVGIPTSVSPTSAVVVDMDFNENLGLAATNGEYILRSDDYGQTWDTVNTNIDANTMISSVLIIDEFIAYAGYESNGMSFGLLKTEDGGLSWFQDMNSATFFYPKWNCLDQSESTVINHSRPIYAGASIETGTSTGFNGMIFESSDGFSWTYSEVAESINAIASNDYEEFIDFTGSTNLMKKTFAVGNSGYLITNHMIQNLSIEESDEVEVEIYPNPAIDQITIKLDKANDWTVKIIDHSMKEVRVDIESYSSEKIINISSLASGVYYITLTKEGQKIIKTVVKK